VEPRHTALSLCKAITAKAVISKLHSGAKPLSVVTDEEILKLCAEVWKREISDPAVNQDELNEIVIQAKPGNEDETATSAVTKGENVR